MNGIVIINKPSGITSRDCVNKLSKILHTKKIGHTGTLDPIASGVLVCVVGECTKLCDILTSKYKEYIGTIKLGIKTDTGDITGNTIEEQDIKIFTKDEIINVLNSFLGHSMQTVPIYSAIKINGKKLYEYARENKSIELPEREIDITSIELLDYHDDIIKFKVTVSKGTYIRSLIEDICKKLNTIGTMSALIRTKQGKFTIEESNILPEYKLLEKEQVLNDIESINIDEELYNKVINGQIIDKIFNNDYCNLIYKNKIVAIYQTYHKDNSKAKPYIMFNNEI